MRTASTGSRLFRAEAHRRYTRLVNFRERWRGYLWQGRFASFPMDESHLLAAARYVELNPVRARLAAAARDWPWSSARAHLAGRDDGVVQVKPLKRRTTLAISGAPRFSSFVGRRICGKQPFVSLILLTSQGCTSGTSRKDADQQNCDKVLEMRSPPRFSHGDPRGGAAEKKVEDRSLRHWPKVGKVGAPVLGVGLAALLLERSRRRASWPPRRRSGCADR